jgi:hypothetical protein
MSNAQQQFGIFPFSDQRVFFDGTLVCAGCGLYDDRPLSQGWTGLNEKIKEGLIVAVRHTQIYYERNPHSRTLPHAYIEGFAHKNCVARAKKNWGP